MTREEIHNAVDGLRVNDGSREWALQVTAVEKRPHNEWMVVFRLLGPVDLQRDVQIHLDPDRTRSADDVQAAVRNVAFDVLSGRLPQNG